MPGASATAATAAAIALTAAGVDWLSRRALRRSQRAMRAQHAAALARLPSSDAALQAAVVEVLERRRDVPWREIATPITDLVHARLDDTDVDTVEARLDGDPAVLYATCDPLTRKRIALNFAAAYGVEAVLERAGVSSATPPDDVHAMARGIVASGGDFFLADLVFDALGHAGVRVPQGGTVLDFGASSGRVLRAIAAGRPDLTCIGCDPNDGAVGWADEHLPMAEFFVSPQRPPLPLGDGTIDMAYAVSIWSHFAEEPALAWLTEMHRVLAPGGTLVMTTHGIDCLSTLLRRGDVSDETASSAAISILQGRLHFVDVFGPDGDWGVKDTGWGNAFFPVDWLLEHAGDDWTVRLAWPGALDQVQDVIVLERR